MSGENIEERLQALKKEIKAFSYRFSSNSKSAELANKIEDMLLDEYSKKEAAIFGADVLKEVKSLEMSNSDYKALLILGLTDQIALGIRPGSKQEVMDNMLTSKNGAINAKSRENVRLILTRDSHYSGLLRWNQFTEQAEYRKDSKTNNYVPVDDKFTNQLTDNIERYYRYTPSTQTVLAGIKLAALNNSYNPVKQRIESVKWDGKKRAATFFIDYLGADNSDYVKAVTETWLTGLVARAYNPGVKFDMVPVIDGAQGIGKSSLISLLSEPKYFDDSLMTMGVRKDDLIKVHAKWLIEIGELEAMNETSISRTKSFVTATSDSYRSPYGTINEDHPRKNVFIGTVNRTEYLHDLTGNRRFFPIHCEIKRATKKLPRPGDYNNSEILQVLAEAKTLYNNGHPLMLSKSMQATAQQKQAEANTLDMQANLMKEYANLLVPVDWDKFSIFQRREYWKRVRDEGVYAYVTQSKDSDNVRTIIAKEDLHRMKSFTNSELLQVAFNQTDKEIAKGGQNSLTTKIAMVFDGDPEWKKSNHCKLFGKERKGYKRTAGTARTIQK